MASTNSVLNRHIGEVTFTVLDIETTGLESYLGHRMCEIGLLKFCGTKELGSYSSLVNPEQPIPEDAVKVHGITDKMVGDAPVFESIAGDFLAFIEETVLIAHNADFDLGFIAKHLREAKLVIPHNIVVDTLTLARRHFRFPDNSLETIASCLGIDTEGGHRALKDASVTKEVFQCFTAQLEVKTLKELLDLQGSSIRFPEIEEISRSPVINEALRTGGKLFLKYVSSSGEETERVVTPIEVNVQRGAEYLRAFCHLRNEERVFRMDRILESRPVEEKGDGSIFLPKK